MTRCVITTGNPTDRDETRASKASKRSGSAIVTHRSRSSPSGSLMGFPLLSQLTRASNSTTNLITVLSICYQFVIGLVIRLLSGCYQSVIRLVIRLLSGCYQIIKSHILTVHIFDQQQFIKPTQSITPRINALIYKYLKSFRPKSTRN